jgi:hypothetical protein
MTMILDVAATISSPPSMVLFDDTGHSSVYYAPREWRVAQINGRDAIQYNEWPSDDIAFLSVVMAPFVDPTELAGLKATAQRLGIVVQPVRYLGKDDMTGKGTRMTFPYAFPNDPKFRCDVNGGQGGSFANPIPMVFSTNLRVGRVLRDIVRDPAQPVGLVFQISSTIRGATTAFQAKVTLDYDRTYTLLSVSTSWSWWLWSGDFQAAWQTLLQSGAVKVEILGGTADQKTIAYKMAEWLRDMFFKAELGNVTHPQEPNTGIIRTSVRYEQQYEHKHFEIDFNERDFAEAPYTTSGCTGNHPLTVALAGAAADLALPVYRSLMARATPARYDVFPTSFVAASQYLAARAADEFTTAGSIT